MALGVCCPDCEQNGSVAEPSVYWPMRLLLLAAILLLGVGCDPEQAPDVETTPTSSANETLAPVVTASDTTSDDSNEAESTASMAATSIAPVATTSVASTTTTTTSNSPETTTVASSTGQAGTSSSSVATTSAVTGSNSTGVSSASETSRAATSDASSTSDSTDTETGDPLCPASAVFCEGFEDGNLDKWSAKNEQGGTLAIASEERSSGSSALRIDIPGNQNGGFLELSGAPLFPLPNKAMYGRLMILFEGLLDGHTDIIRGAGSDGAVPYYNVGSQHEEILLNYFERYPGVDCWARPMPSYLLTANQWMCWEWVFDGETNVLEFYIDGALERRVEQNGDGCLEGTPEWAAPDFATLAIGAYNAEKQNDTQPVRLWIDDVAVGSSERIGCPGD